MLVVLLALVGCAGGDCDQGAPSFYVNVVNENDVFIEDIDIEWARTPENEGDQVNRTPCVLAEFWECADGAPGTYDVFVGGPGWMRQRKHIDVPVPPDACYPDRPTLDVKVVPEEE